MSAWPWMSQGQRDRMEREDAREAREHKARQVARADAEEQRIFRAQHADRVFEYEHGYSQSEYRQALAEIAVAREQRRADAEYGSVARQAMFIDGRELAPQEPARRELVNEHELDRMLARSRENDLWMTDYLVRHDYPAALARARAKQAAGRTVSRTASGAGWPEGREITRVCSGDGEISYGGMGEISR